MDSRLPKNPPGKNTRDMMSILKYFRPLREKPDLPDPSGPLRETVPPTTIVAANAKVIEALNEAELKKVQAGPLERIHF